MKTIAKMLYVAVAAALTLSACHKDKVVYNEPDKPATENVGYLLLGDMQAKASAITEADGSSSKTNSSIFSSTGISSSSNNNETEVAILFKFSL